MAIHPADAATGHAEFFNELEGYWLHLPGSLRSRAYFEVDGKSRMVKGFVNSRLKTPKWYFVDPEADLPWDVREEKLAGQRALYVHLDALDLPPAKPHELTPAFIEAVGGTAQPKYGWTDVSRFSALGVPAVNYGPGNPHLAHRRDERVDPAKILTGEERLRSWLTA